MLVPDTIIVFLAINLILMDLVSRFLRVSLSVRSAIQPSSSNQPARRGCERSVTVVVKKVRYKLLKIINNIFKKSFGTLLTNVLINHVRYKWEYTELELKRK